MDPTLQPYLEMLKRHARQVQVPGLKRSYTIALAEIFIETQVEAPAPARDASDKAGRPKSRIGRRQQDREIQPEPEPKPLLEPALSILNSDAQLVLLGEPG